MSKTNALFNEQVNEKDLSLRKTVGFAACCLLSLLALLAALCFPNASAFASDTVTLENLSGNEARDTAIEISKATFTDGETTNAIIARDDDFADAMSSAGLAGQLNAPILLIDRSAGVSDALRAELERLGVRNVYVIGGTGAIPADVATQLGGAYTTKRIYGTEAAETSVECAKELSTLSGKSLEYAVVAMSDNFQDALSMSSFAYAYKAPIILETSAATAADRHLPEGALTLLNSATNAVFIAGGTGALSDDSVSAVTPSKVRLWGKDGYDTSNQIANYMHANGLLSADTVTVANGDALFKGVDALAGAAYAGKHNGVLLLVNGVDWWWSGLDVGDYDQTVFGYGSGSKDSQDDPSFMFYEGRSCSLIMTLGGETVMPTSFRQRMVDLVNNYKENAPKYSYQLYSLNTEGWGWYSGCASAIFIKTDNPDRDSIRIESSDAMATWNGIEYDDVAYLDAGTDVIYSIRPVDGGYIANISFDEAGVNDVIIGEHPSESSEYSDYSIAVRATVNVKDYDTAFNEWADDIIAKTTTSDMDPFEKMSAVSSWLLSHFKYHATVYTSDDPDDYEWVYASYATSDGPCFETYRWDSYVSPSALCRFAERIGGFDDIHNCYGDYYRSDPEWAYTHYLCRVTIGDEVKYYMACPAAEDTVRPSEITKIDFSDTSKMTWMGTYSK